jgi:hypothetical protein
VEARKADGCLDISPLFFHIVFKLVQALFIIYDEIFQAVAVKGDVLFLKTFLDLTAQHPSFSSDSAPLDFKCLAN